jgi:hypothetical protein
LNVLIHFHLYHPFLHHLKFDEQLFSSHHYYFHYHFLHYRRHLIYGVTISKIIRLNKRSKKKQLFFLLVDHFHRHFYSHCLHRYYSHVHVLQVMMNLLLNELMHDHHHSHVLLILIVVNDVLNDYSFFLLVILILNDDVYHLNYHQIVSCHDHDWNHQNQFHHVNDF